MPLEIGGLGAQGSSGGSAPRRPGFGITVFTMLLPVLLMLLGTVADVELAKESVVRQWADFFGAPTVALLVAVLTAFCTFGTNCGLTGRQILRFSEECLAPAAALFLVIGAGGGFSKVLNDSGVGAAIATRAASFPVSPLVLGWAIAGLLRVAVGSATVAVTMAAGLMTPAARQPCLSARESRAARAGHGRRLAHPVSRQ